jgi:hypothetical protein
VRRVCTVRQHCAEVTLQLSHYYYLLSIVRCAMSERELTDQRLGAPKEQPERGRESPYHSRRGPLHSARPIAFWRLIALSFPQFTTTIQLSPIKNAPSSPLILASTPARPENPIIGFPLRPTDSGGRCPVTSCHWLQGESHLSLLQQSRGDTEAA